MEVTFAPDVSTTLDEAQRVSSPSQFPENDDGEHLVWVEGKVFPAGPCEPPLGTLSVAFDTVIGPVGDVVAGRNRYTILSFDTATWQLNGRLLLFLTEIQSSGQPFSDLGPRMIVEALDSAEQFPDRDVNPDEVEGGGYAEVGRFDRAELYSPEGVDITAGVRAVLSRTHERYLYLRFRFPICQDGDSFPDHSDIAVGAGTSGRAHIVVPEPSGVALALCAFATVSLLSLMRRTRWALLLSGSKPQQAGLERRIVNSSGVFCTTAKY